MLANARSGNSLARRWTALTNYVKPGLGHLFMYVMGRFQPVRHAAAFFYRIPPLRRTALQPTARSVEDLELDRVVSSLRRNGMAGGLQLRPEAFQELMSFCDDSICFGDGKRQYPFLIRNRGIAESEHGINFTMGRYLGALNTCSRLRQLTTDPTLLSIARNYLGAEPALVGARIWWSFPASSDSSRQRRDGQQFHFDLDDYRAISFFFYLSDVDRGCGPHVFIKGSHRWKPLRFLLSPAKSKSDTDIVSAYGQQSITTVCGNAGSGFVEDLFCYHKGAHPESADRLLLQVRFGFKKYGENKEE